MDINHEVFGGIKMNYKQLTQIGIKLIALFYFMSYMVYAITSVFSFFQMLKEGSGAFSLGLLSMMLPIVIMVSLSVLLWVYADRIADRIVDRFQGGEKVEANNLQMDYERIQYVLLGIAGILILAKGLPDLFTNLYHFISIRSMEAQGVGSMYSDLKAKTLGACIQTAIGVWLTLGTTSFSNLLKKIRAAGVNEEGEAI